MNLAPIVLFVYNRPEHTHKTLNSLSKNELAQQSILYIFADGPKEDADEKTLRNIRDVRKIINTIKGFKKVILTEHNINKGLDPSVIDGVSEVINKHGKCIVIEDDIVTHPWFLHFMNECLEIYEDDKRVSMVGGYTPRFNKPFNYRRDMFLVHRCCSWGWGTWKNVWNQVDWTMSDFNDFIKNKEKIKELSRGGQDIVNTLLQQNKESIYTWDAIFDYFLCITNTYCVRYTKSLTRNIGFDGTGIHCIANFDINSRTADFPPSIKYDINTQDVIISRHIERRFQAFYNGKLTGIEIIWKPLKHHLHVCRLFLFSLFDPSKI